MFQSKGTMFPKNYKLVSPGLSMTSYLTGPEDRTMP